MNVCCIRSRAASFALALCLVAACGGCAAQASVDYPAGYSEDDDYPPDAYIATVDPDYIDGHAAYWYGGHWYWRDGGHWRHYAREPATLRARRLRAPPAYRTYEPARAHVRARPALHGGTHGSVRGAGAHHR